MVLGGTMVSGCNQPALSSLGGQTSIVPILEGVLFASKIQRAAERSQGISTESILQGISLLIAVTEHEANRRT